ncbi:MULTISPECIES: M16 family metallopeptidase [Actinotignum]|uniref:Pitrilysin family protein n=3 Tax=Actinotignum timonense TaxID=1870995 RepID=A0AAW9H9I7_9ACTO|nr:MULTISPECIES: pitrilysin family protein [Actinotignum]MBS5748230.1 insulinase family protein [Actinotignum schaalii]MDE1557694.1 pitrilysin family protein [Actinotignum schaalii]MDE1662937.1 pitrilysin family protein [Actinotignum schaalii]MDK6372659.1 pitrilysin family protein [Actinotignum timonense]MDK6418310.1 pitrilysin family protein [Actinotignum timonense]
MMYSELPLPLNAGASLNIDDDGALLRRTVLPGGLRVLSYRLPHIHSTYVSMWVGAGSRDEVAETQGSTHFLEHLLFKGTKRRSSLDISRETDYLGGGFNAATSKQYTHYHGHIFDEDLPQAIDILADMLTSATLSAEDFAVERGVILEELAMYADDATDTAMEKIPQLVFGDHPLARPVGGTAQTVRALQHEALLEHYHGVYHPDEVVVVAAGAVDHERLCELAVEALSAGGWDLSTERDAHPRRIAPPIVYQEARELHVPKEVEQAAVIVGMPGLSLTSEDLPTLLALNAILGGGTSSRLFQEIRERRALAYSTYSFPISYREGGMFCLAAGCAPHNVGTVRELMMTELDRLARDGVSEEETESAFRRLRADIVFDAERVGTAMTRLGTSELVRGSLISHEEHLRRARAVRAADINELARRIAAGQRSCVTVGPEN